MKEHTMPNFFAVQIIDGQKYVTVATVTDIEDAYECASYIPDDDVRIIDEVSGQIVFQDKD